MYLKHNNKNDYWVFDIETNGLTPDKIWCAVFKNLGNGVKRVFKYNNDAGVLHDIKQFIDDHPSAYWVGHNAVSFDIPVINRLCGTSVPIDRVVDTLVLSYLYNPHLEGGHNLEAYGERVGVKKIEYDRWDVYNEKIVERCESDVEITIRAYQGLIARMNAVGYSETSCEIEHRIREIIDRQKRHGFWFNTLGARNILRLIRKRQADLAEQVYGLFPPKLEEVGRYKIRRKADGSYYASFERHLREHDKLEIFEDLGEYATYDYQQFNIGSPKQRIERLMELGWEPVKLTKKGNPQLDEDSLLAYAELSGRAEIRAMADWLVCFGRGNMLETWLSCVGPDSRIHGDIFTCGASTRRMTHNNPNTANIPSGAKARYGKICRALWGVAPGSGLVEVGYDASGLETAGLCHYLSNPKATEVLIRPKPNDIHTSNSRALTEVLGWPVDREWGAKTSWYAWLYGAYPPKLGSIVKGTPEDGQKVIDTFFKNVPGLGNLIDSVHSEYAYNHGRLVTIDGGSVICPSKNASLNYKIQSMGAIVMKLTSIILDRLSYEQGIEHHKVGDIHDEGQHEVTRRDAKRLGELAISSITKAGEQLGCRVTLTGDYKIGRNWAECH